MIETGPGAPHIRATCYISTWAHFRENYVHSDHFVSLSIQRPELAFSALIGSIKLKKKSISAQ